MDAVDIFLLYVVGFSVILFLIVDSYGEGRKAWHRGDRRRVDNDSEILLESVKASDDQEEENCGTQLVSENHKRELVFQEIKEEEIRVKGSGDETWFDDWEGIERTELEKRFGEAVVYVSGKSIDGDVKMELYGLEKVALEGDSGGSQRPMLFNVSARSKWNAWEKVGKMSREMAMEKYISTLEDAIPGWNQVEGTC